MTLLLREMMLYLVLRPTLDDDMDMEASFLSLDLGAKYY